MHKMYKQLGTVTVVTILLALVATISCEYSIKVVDCKVADFQQLRVYEAFQALPQFAQKLVRQTKGQIFDFSSDNGWKFLGEPISSATYKLEGNEAAKSVVGKILASNNIVKEDMMASCAGFLRQARAWLENARELSDRQGTPNHEIWIASIDVGFRGVLEAYVICKNL